MTAQQQQQQQGLPPLPPIAPGQPKHILLVLIHGFLGSEESFFSFPTDLVSDMERRLGFPAGRIETRMFPRYDTRGHNARSVQKLIDWLLVYATTGRYEAVVLMAHSMGGLLAADAYQYMYALHKEKVEERLNGTVPGGPPPPTKEAGEAEPKGEQALAKSALQSADVDSGSLHSVESELATLEASLQSLVIREEELDAAGLAAVLKDAEQAKNLDGKSDAANAPSATVPTSSPAGSSLSAISSWFGRWGKKDATPPPVSSTAPSPTGAVDEDGFEGTEKTSPDSDVRLLVNIRGIISFDSPFYGLHANVITQAGTNKAVALVSEGILNPRAYLPAAVETVSAYAPKTIPVPTGFSTLSSVAIPTAWVVDAAKRVVGAGGQATPSPAASGPCAAATPAPTGTPMIEQVDAASIPSTGEVPPPTPTTPLAAVPPASAPAPTFASRVPGWVGYALGGAAVAATAYAVAPLAVAYIPAGMIASSMATSLAISGAEQIRDHLHFLYPLVNSQYDMHQRVQMLQREMEGRRRLTFKGFYLDLPPHPKPPPPPPPAAKPDNTAPPKEKPEPPQQIQMIELDAAASSPPTAAELLVSLPTPHAKDPASTPVPVSAPPPPSPPASQTSAPPTPPPEAPPSSPPPPPQPQPSQQPGPSTMPTRNFCNLPPSDTRHLFFPITHPHLNEIDAHMNLFNAECGAEWYVGLIQQTADAVKGVLDVEMRRGKDGVLRPE